MQVYSAYRRERSLQVVADVLTVVGMALFVTLGLTVGSLISALGKLGEGIESAGTGLSGTLSDAASSLGGIPLIGSTASSPFDSASAAASGLADAGRAQQSIVGASALVVGLIIAVVPVALIALVWFRSRGRFIGRAAEARSLVALPGGFDLLALRALANQRSTALLAVGPNPLGAWRSGDEAVIQRLAGLELRAAGVRLAPTLVS